METKRSAFSRSYLAALSRHLAPSPRSDLQGARRLGVRALKLGLETLDLARIHEEALIALMLPPHSNRLSDDLLRRAGVFFAEAITPIEETHRGALEDNANLKGMIESLRQRTGELADSNRDLKLEIVQRRASEASLRISESTSSQLLEKSRDLQEELRYLSRRLLSIQEEERKRISRELHDVIAQTLAGINLNLAALKLQTTANTRELHEKIAATQRLVEDSVETVRQFARDLRPTVLDDLGLIPALHSYLKHFREQTGIRASFTAFSGVEEEDIGRRTVLYRVAQEALTNVVRHAKAGGVVVSIRKHARTLRMEITDNGMGFRLQHSTKSDRLGLLGMRERVEMIGGTFSVESKAGEGTTVRAEIPLSSSEKASRPRKVSPRSVRPSK